jgi:hypothetical protein
LRDLYHNATPNYPSLDDKEGAEFQAWFEDAAESEIDYLRDGGAYGTDYRKTLAAPCNAGRYQSEKARAYYIERGMRKMREERDDCGALQGWHMVELAAGNKTLARALKRIFRNRTPKRNNALWEFIGEYGKLYQYGRGGRTLAPDDLVRSRGMSWGIREDYAEEISIAACVRLIQIVESFNRYVAEWCRSVPEQWAEVVRERKAEERAQRRACLAKLRAAKQMRERCETYAG